MKRAAVVCAGGIGDSLLMMIVARHFKEEGYQVTVFGDCARLIAPLFEGYVFTSDLSLETLEKRLLLFDRIIVQDDLSQRSYFFSDFREKWPDRSLIFFLPLPSRKQCRGDFPFNQNESMATNIAHICSHLFETKRASKENGVIKPKEKVYRKFPRRIVIHPTSTSQLKKLELSLIS